MSFFTQQRSSTPPRKLYRGSTAGLSETLKTLAAP